MLPLQTPVTSGPAPVSISYGDHITVLGSCFATQIGDRLAEAGFNVLAHPFGPLFNPVSIVNAMARLQNGIPFTEREVVPMGAGSGRFCSFSHHTSFARKTPASFLEEANGQLEKAAAFWKTSDKVILSLGTAWAYRYRETGETVANCLKRPGKEFERYRLEVSQVAALLRGAFPAYPGKQFILTVSPVRHLADGAHGNQLSKSTLLLGVEAVLGAHAAYFPAYEIMLDELRDYRWWAEDMVHPSVQAASYICDRFIDWALPVDEKEMYDRKMREFRASRHHPLYSE